MKEPLISVIIPVYKVEHYLRRCLESVVGQTYKRLEIILVDDGSPDLCGAICDEYAAQDDRICVIHKANGGVSSARNAGLNACTGDWIGWVDSDDWIEPDMFAYMLGAAQAHDADIVVCSRYEHSKDSDKFRGWEQETPLDTENALGFLLRNDVMQNFLWDKLWRRQLFAGVRFPEGRTYEDIAVMHRLFEHAERIICLPEGKYHYWQRPGSIVGDVSLKNRLNHYAAAKERYDDMRERWPQFSDCLEGQCVAAAINIWCAFLQNDKETRRLYLPQLKKIAGFSKEHYRDAPKNLGLGLAGKIIVRLTPYTTWWSFLLASLCGQLYKLKHGRAL